MHAFRQRRDRPAVVCVIQWHSPKSKAEQGRAFQRALRVRSMRAGHQDDENRQGHHDNQPDRVVHGEIVGDYQHLFHA